MRSAARQALNCSAEKARRWSSAESHSCLLSLMATHPARRATSTQACGFCPLLVALLAPRFGKLAARIGQRPLIVVGGLVYAAGGAWRLVTFAAEPAFLTAYLPSMLLTGTGVALCIPQLSSVIGQSLPPNRFGVGGAVNQALRQLGGTLGVAIAVGFVSGATGIDDALGRFERIWWMIVGGGVLTTLLAIPLRTVPRSAADPVDVNAVVVDVAVVD